MTIVEKRMRTFKLAHETDFSPTNEPPKAYDPVVLDNVGGEFRLRKADPMREQPHAILNADMQISEDGREIYVPAWWFDALIKRYNQEHLHA